MTAWDSLVLLGTLLAILASEAVLLYASTALGNVGLNLSKWLLASALTAGVWGGVVLLVCSGRSFAPKEWGTLLWAAAGGLFVSWLVPGLLFAWALSTSVRRGMLVSAYQLVLRALTCLLAGATAAILLRLLLAASALSCDSDWLPP